MSEAKPTPWKLVVCVNAIYAEAPGQDNVRFIGPDREANARLFIRAQHMNELVEAVTPRLSKATRKTLLALAEDEAAIGSDEIADAIKFLLEQEDRRTAILAKIKDAQ